YASPAASQRLVTLAEKDIGSVKLDATGGYSGPTQDDWGLELLRDENGKPLPVELTAGLHKLRLANTDGKGCNLDYLEFLPVPEGP
ncbi:MAG: hypothetical protein HY318_11155, partial [Armatimonadetes bacterium]|nr:hypothetical protein [Armatimonadota bacterium]